MSRRPLGPRIVVVLSGSAGVFVALQSHFNGELGIIVENPYLAGFLSCSLGLILLLSVHASSAGSRAALRVFRTEIRSGNLPWWTLTGGFFGAFLVFAQSLSIGVLGVALFSVGTVVGQVVGGIWIDRSGFGAEESIQISFRRVMGAVIAVSAILVTGLGVFGDTGFPWLLAVPVVAGAGTGWQAAVNGVMRKSLGSVVAVTLINFSIGWFLLLIGSVVSFFVQGFPTQWPTDPVSYMGGILGVLYVGLSAFLVRINGVLVLGLFIIAGQLLAAVLIDGVNPAGPSPTLEVALGVGLAILAAAVTSGSLSRVHLKKQS